VIYLYLEDFQEKVLNRMSFFRSARASDARKPQFHQSSREGERMKPRRVKRRRFKNHREERRDSIIQAVRCVFAEKGFRGATTRELADAAGVSEALLFKHFPDKEAIYRAMLEQCCAQDRACEWEKIAAMKPSTATLIISCAT